MKRPPKWPLLLVLLVVLVMPTVAMADDLVPRRPLTAVPYPIESTPLYERFEPWAYTFEGDSWNTAGFSQTYQMTNFLLVAKAWLVKIAIRSVEWSLAQDMYKEVAERAATALSALGTLMWEDDGAPLVAGALSLTGLWTIILHVRGLGSRAWGVMGGTVLVIVVTTTVMADGVRAVGVMVDVARGVSTQVFGLVDDASRPATGPGLVVRSGDAAWRAIVYEPWVLGEFGTELGREHFRSADGLDGGALLARTQKERQTSTTECQEYQTGYQSTFCPWWDETYLTRRLFLATATFGIGAVYAGAVLCLAGGVLVAQLALLIMVGLAPVWLLVALWYPGAGVRLLNQLARKAVGALITQVVLTATLALLLLVSDLSFTAFQTVGWMFQAILLAVLGGLAFRYRYAWLIPFSTLASHRENQDSRPLEHLRDWLAGRRRTEAMGATTPKAVTVTQLVPAFTDVLPPTVVFDASPPQGEFSERAPKEGRHDGEVPHVSAAETFRREMQVLRERISTYQQVVRQESITEEARRDWHEPPPSLPSKRGVLSSRIPVGGITRERVTDAGTGQRQQPKP